MCVHVATSEGAGQIIAVFLAPIQKSATASGLTIPGYAPNASGKPEVELQLTGVVAMDSGQGFVVGPLSAMQILKEVDLASTKPAQKKESKDDEH